MYFLESPGLLKAALFPPTCRLAGNVEMTLSTRLEKWRSKLQLEKMCRQNIAGFSLLMARRRTLFFSLPPKPINRIVSIIRLMPVRSFAGYVPPTTLVKSFAHRYRLLVTARSRGYGNMVYFYLPRGSIVICWKNGPCRVKASFMIPGIALLI